MAAEPFEVSVTEAEIADLREPSLVPAAERVTGDFALHRFMVTYMGPNSRTVAYRRVDQPVASSLHEWGPS
jgi:hypothetical protein